MSFELKLLALAIWTAAVAACAWQAAKTRYELREARQATQGLVQERKRSQRADSLAGAHAEWQQKHQAVVRKQEIIVETEFHDGAEGQLWADQPLSPGVRQSLAVAAAAIAATEYADCGVPGAGRAGPADQWRCGEGVDRSAGWLEGLPRAASQPH